MELSQDEILEILKLMDESPFDELRLETGDMNLVVVKGGKGRFVQELESTSQAPTELISLKKPEVTEKKEKAVTDILVVPETAKPEVTTAEEKLIPIKSQMLGTFYRSPEPGASPFVDVGTLVKEDDTVCMIEVMKCFTTIKAMLHGYIKKVCAEDGHMVEFGQELFLVEPVDKQ